MCNSLRTFCVLAILTILAAWPAAAQMIDSADIIDESIQGVDIKNGSLTDVSDGDDDANHLPPHLTRIVVQQAGDAADMLVD